MTETERNEIVEKLYAEVDSTNLKIKALLNSKISKSKLRKRFPPLQKRVIKLLKELEPYERITTVTFSGKIFSPGCPEGESVPDQVIVLKS